jgi:hypothetical protein
VIHFYYYGLSWLGSGVRHHRLDTPVVLLPLAVESMTKKGGIVLRLTLLF